MGDPHCTVYGKRTSLGVLVGLGGKSDRPKLDRSLSDHLPRTASSSSLKNAGDPEVGGRHRTDKTGRQRLRWNLLFNAILWVLLPIPIWLPILDRHLGTSISVYLIPGIQTIFALFFTLVTILAIRSALILHWNSKRDFVKKMKKHMLKLEDVHHLVVLSVYKEPLDLITATVETLAKQNSLIRKRTTLVIGFEEKTPDLRAKQSVLCEEFRKHFEEILFTVHPSGVEGEIPGKCSNSNCAIRTGLSHLEKMHGSNFNPELVLITNGDSDNKFHPRYLEALTYQFLTAKDRGHCIYQAPLLYNWNLDESFFVTRVTGLLRAFLMMGALIPMNINTMSVFSFSASLCIAGDYIHPGYQMDDIIALIRWMGVCRRGLRVVMVPVAIVSGPTSGRIPEDETREWARQARRWTIGAAEVFHYFMAKAHGIPFLTSLSWGTLFMFYYGIVLCCSSIYAVIAGVSVAVFFSDNQILQYVMVGFLAHQYLVFLVVFILDKVTVRLAEPKVKEGISHVRNLLQLLFAPLVLLLYSLVELAALHEIAVRGREVCAHKPSKKDQLATRAGSANPVFSV